MLCFRLLQNIQVALFDKSSGLDNRTLLVAFETLRGSGAFPSNRSNETGPQNRKAIPRVRAWRNIFSANYGYDFISKYGASGTTPKAAWWNASAISSPEYAVVFPDYDQFAIGNNFGWAIRFARCVVYGHVCMMSVHEDAILIYNTMCRILCSVHLTRQGRNVAFRSGVSVGVIPMRSVLGRFIGSGSMDGRFDESLVLTLNTTESHLE